MATQKCLPNNWSAHWILTKRIKSQLIHSTHTYREREKETVKFHQQKQQRHQRKQLRIFAHLLGNLRKLSKDKSVRVSLLLRNISILFPCHRQSLRSLNSIAIVTKSENIKCRFVYWKSLKRYRLSVAVFVVVASRNDVDLSTQTSEVKN